MAKKEKTELEIFEEFVDWFYELMWGEPRRPEKKFEGMVMKKPPTKRKRARTKDGRYRGDNKSTPDVNEAWENEE